VSNSSSDQEDSDTNAELGEGERAVAAVESGSRPGEEEAPGAPTASGERPAAEPEPIPEPTPGPTAVVEPEPIPEPESTVVVEREREREPVGRLSDVASGTVPRRRSWWQKHWQALLCLVMIVALGLVGLWSGSTDTLVTADPSYHLTDWLYLGVAAIFIFVTLLVGWEIKGYWSGVLIDPKKQRMSLARIQTILWTVLIVASYYTAVLINLAKTNESNASAIDALDIAIPGELLVAMGISVGSLVGSKVVLNYKANEHGTVAEVPEPSVSPQGMVESAVPPGAVYRGDRPQWRDLFQGDTVESKDSVDLGKLQMFYVTIALLIGYGLVVADVFASVPAAGITTLPALNAGFIALLAISHAGYLTAKATS
jgi:hypothetical protein